MSAFDNMDESLMSRLIHRKCSCAGEEAEEETHTEDPGVLSGGRDLHRPQEEGTACMSMYSSVRIYPLRYESNTPTLK